LGWAKKLILTLKWENVVEVKDITHPILFISGSADTFVPTHQTKELHVSAVKADFKEIYIVEGGEHNNTFMVGGEDYFNKLEWFHQKCCKEPIQNHGDRNLVQWAHEME